MSAPWADWDHVLKLDPDKDLYGDETFADVCATGTDAIAVGGTTGMTEAKMATVVAACADHDVPLYIEPSHPGAVVHDDALAGYLVPVVFNAGDPAWTTGAHKEWARIDDDIDWERTHTEGYIVCNEDSAVARYTQADCDLTAEDVAAYAAIADRLFGQDIVYVEYSGTFGDPDVVAAAAAKVDDAHLFYGGGIGDYDSAKTMAEHADVVVVGDLVHDEGCEAVAETVAGAKDA